MNIEDWFDRRAEFRAAFLALHGWEGASAQRIGADCAFRRYTRLHHRRDGARVILMESVPDGHAIATPGHKIGDFVRIAGYLQDCGLAAPQIFAADEPGGYLLLEDFGDLSFKAAAEQGVPVKQLYGLATDILAHLRRHIPPPTLALPAYYDSHVHVGRRRLIDWYWPCINRCAAPDGLAEEYLAVWDEIEAGLPPVPQGFLHIDYHFENLMWRPEQEGMACAGLLDFQGAMHGPLPYDLANLLEDARVDVPATLKEAMIARFCRDMDQVERAIFADWYRVLATQFHCRVAGQFIRLALRDGKDRYLVHLPRVQNYIAAALEQPVLAPLQRWCAARRLSFDGTPEINPAYIGSDAF